PPKTPQDPPNFRETGQILAVHRPFSGKWGGSWTRIARLPGSWEALGHALPAAGDVGWIWRRARPRSGAFVARGAGTRVDLGGGRASAPPRLAGRAAHRVRSGAAADAGIDRRTGWLGGGSRRLGEWRPEL